MTAHQTTVAALAAERTLTDLKATRNGHRNAVEYLQQTGQPSPTHWPTNSTCSSGPSH